MPEMISIVGFSPERMPEAMSLIHEYDINALVFRGMVAGVQGQLRELYDASFVEGAINKHAYPGGVTRTLQGLGFDLGHFSRQPLDTELWPSNTVQHTSIELVETGRGIGWHTDVVGTDNDNELYLPYGLAFSLNLAGQAIFSVVEERSQIIVPGRTLSKYQLNMLESEATLEDIGHATILEGFLEPGDVVCWRQPVAHQVTVLDEARHAIVLIQEDYVTSVD